MTVDDDGEGERVDMGESKDGAVVSLVGRCDEAIAQESESATPWTGGRGLGDINHA